VGILSLFEFKNLVVKQGNTTTIQGRMICRSLQLYREARFYSSPLFTSQFAPKPYFTWYNAWLGDYCIIMEQVQGKHLPFVQQVLINCPASLDDKLIALFEQVADFHAKHWEDPALLSQSWLKGSNWYGKQGQGAYVQKVTRAKEMFFNSTRLHLLPLGLSTLMKQWFEIPAEQHFGQLQQHIAIAPFTLCHGDFHNGNILLDKDHFTFLDFSEVGVFDPIYDLAQFILSDVDGRLYSRLIKGLIAKWHVKIAVSCSVKDTYNVQMCYLTLLQAGMNRWMYLLAVLIGMPQVQEERIQFWSHNLMHWHKLLCVEEGVVEEKCFFFKY
jgi:hypothetical protein